MGYRVGSLWNETNEIRCLIAFKKLQAEGFPRGRQMEMSRELSGLTGISAGSLHSKIGNYKSMAGVIGDSNASQGTRDVYRQYGGSSIAELESLLSQRRGMS